MLNAGTIVELLTRELVLGLRGRSVLEHQLENSPNVCARVLCNVGSSTSFENTIAATDMNFTDRRGLTNYTEEQYSF
eukprot:8451375-Pyramimonas_sp.AAC.1